ncbi:MAG: DUF3037 domain-containing protein [Leucobacter sp.]
MSYQYWIIRYVPNIARGEFTNIGILCGRDGSDWAVRFDTRAVRNRGRLGTDLHELGPWVSWLKRRIERHGSVEFDGEPVSSGWVGHLRTRQANSVQFSEPNAIDVPSAAEGVALLFPHLVERETVKRQRALSRTSMRAEVRETLQFEFDLALGRDLFVQPKASIGKQRSTFDFMRRDHQTDGLLNVWAFNTADVELLEQQVQASNYFLTRLRDGGADMRLGAERTVTVDSDVPVNVIYDPPTSQREAQWRTDAFEAALEAWNLNDVAVRSLDDFRAEPLGTEQLLEPAH